MWAAKNIRQPSVGEYAFWSMQCLAGKLFPPQFNWYIYRVLRKLWTHRALSQTLWEVWEKITDIFGRGSTWFQARLGLISSKA
jgi:hypothetical protein